MKVGWSRAKLFGWFMVAPFMLTFGYKFGNCMIIDYNTPPRCHEKADIRNINNDGFECPNPGLITTSSSNLPNGQLLFQCICPKHQLFDGGISIIDGSLNNN